MTIDVLPYCEQYTLYVHYKQNILTHVHHIHAHVQATNSKHTTLIDAHSTIRSFGRKDSDKLIRCYLYIIAQLPYN